MYDDPNSLYRSIPPLLQAHSTISPLEPVKAARAVSSALTFLLFHLMRLSVQGDRTGGFKAYVCFLTFGEMTFFNFQLAERVGILLPVSESL
jgi:hypothetical protein